MLNKNTVFAIIALQALILCGMFVKAFYPLYSGQEIKLKTIPRDPRDWFRGNYVDLAYNYSQLDIAKLPNDLDTSQVYSFGDELYLSLKEENGLYEPAGLWTEKPESGQIFLRVVVDAPFDSKSYSVVNLKGGIESYFAPVERALEIENAITNSNSGSQGEPNEAEKAHLELLKDKSDSATYAQRDSIYALAAERQRAIDDRDPLKTVLVTVMVADNGHARIKDIQYPKPAQKANQ